MIRPLLSQWLQLLESCEQILLTGGLEPFGLNHIAGHKLIACQITFFGKLRCPLHHRLDGIQLTAVPKVTQQLNPLLDIQGITEQTLAGDSITSHSLHQIRRKAVVFQLRHDPLPHQLTEVVMQLAGIHRKGREQSSPLLHGVAEEGHEV